MINQNAAVITCFFNPCGFKQTFKNYLIFKEYILSLNYPVYTLELTFGDKEHQTVKDEYTFQIRTNDILWHKERLLNLLFKRIPKNYEKIFWLDSDIRWKNNNSLERAEKLLDNHKIVQLFDNSVYLKKEGGIIKTREGVISAYLKYDKKNFLVSNYNSGFAWSARREFFEKFGLYDRGILGAGDAFMSHAFTKNLSINHYINRFNWNENIVKDYLNWSYNVIEYVGDDIGYLDDEIYHNWHGELKNRKYLQRAEILKNFNPFTMLKEGQNGVWNWTDVVDDEFKNKVINYFHERKEDG